MEYNFKTEEDFPVIYCPDLDEAELIEWTPRRGDCTVAYISDNTMLTKFKKMIIKNPKEWKVTNMYKLSDGRVTGYEITFPKRYKSWFTAGKSRSSNPEAQKRAVEAMNAARKSKQST